MKIGFVSTYLPQRCGIATYSNFLLNALRKVEPELNITVIAEEEAEAKQSNNFQVKPSWNRKQKFSNEVIALIAGQNLIHLQYEPSIFDSIERLSELFKKILPDTKKIVTLHCIRPAQFSLRNREEELELSLANLADKIIVHQKSQYLVLKRWQIPDEKIALIPHGTEISRRDKIEARQMLNLPECAKILLMFGFIKPTKNIHLAVEMLKKIAVEVPDVYLFIAGGLVPNPPKEDQEYLEKIRKKIDELGPLKKRIRFSGYFFPHQDIPLLLASADVVLFPYCDEDRSASGAFHLALGAGKPVAAYRIPKFEELSEICDELLVLPNDRQGLEHTIIRILTDEKFRNFAKEQIEKYAQNTSWEKTAIKHLDVYRSLI